MKHESQSIDQLTPEQLSALSHRLQARRGAPAQTGLIAPRDRRQPCPLSFAQQRLWFVDQLQPHNSAYHIPLALRLIGQLDVRALTATLSEIVRRHEVLRTSFPMRAGEPVQQIAPAGPLPVRSIDLSALEPATAEACANRIVAEEIARGFDLAAGPLFRTSLVTLSPQDHVLLVVMHHLVSDGWSTGILASELRALYTAYRAGRASPLPELAIQYGDFAVWQRRTLTEAALREHVDYWRTQLSGMTPTALPAGRARRPGAARRSGQLPLAIGRHLTEALAALGRREGATLFMTLLAAFQALLARYTGQSDVAIGTVIANRNRLDTEPLIGFFINQLVLRSRFGRADTFRDVLAHVRRTVLEAYEHQDCPFERVVDAVAPARDAAPDTPLFRIAFALQNAPAGDLIMPGLEVQQVAAGDVPVRADITLILGETAAGLGGVLAYDAALFDAPAMEALASAYEALLAGVAADATQPIWRVPIVPATARARLLTAAAGPGVEPAPLTPELFDAHAARPPGAVAIRHGRDTISYGELATRANRLAHHLIDLDAGPDVVVGVALDRGIDLFTALLAILKAGAAYLPIDPRTPPARVAYMLDDSRAPIWIASAAVKAAMPARGAHTIVLDEAAEEIAALSDATVAVPVDPLNLAYVIYTSGSTGTPKAVAVTHGGLANYVRWSAGAYDADAAEGTPLHSTMAVDLTVTSLFVPLCTGGYVDIADDERGVGRLVDRLRVERDYRIVKVTPSHLELLQHELGARPGPLCRVLVVGGEALTYERIAPWRQAARIVNEYGPTETVVGCCAYEVRDEAAEGAVPIGRPIANTTAYVADESGNLAPPFSIGELQIGGDGVARGYLHDPALTAERFVPDPFGSQPGARLYRTGDRVCWRADGELEYLGRIDEQMKIRGYRIDPSEIESVLAVYLGVRQCAVAIAGDGDHKHLVAYVATDGTWCDESELEGVLPNGMHVLQQNKSETAFLYDEVFARQVYLRHGIELPEDACVVDVGANIGLFSLWVGDRCPHARIYAFEPIPSTFAKLERNVAQSRAAIRAFPCGLSDSARYAEFVYYPRYTASSGLAAYAVKGEGEQFLRRYLEHESRRGSDVGEQLLPVADELLAGRFDEQRVICELRTLSDVIRDEQIDRIALLKVDVERSEYDVLAGVAPQDWERIDQIVLEVHDEIGGETGQVAKIAALLQRHRFDVTVEEDEAFAGMAMYLLFARKPSMSRPARTPPIQAPARATPMLSARALRAHAAAKLPDYAVPSRFICLRELPLTPAGKVARQALPAPAPAAAAVDATLPRTPIERVLCEVWQGLLHRERVGIRDNFFSIGGDSIISLQIVARAAQAGVQLTVRDIFEHQTIERLAEVAAHVDPASASSEVASGASPLTPIQAWFFEQPLANPNHYNQALVFDARVPASPRALASLVRSVLAHHQALSSRFERADGHWRQQFDGSAPPDTAIVDLRGLRDGDCTRAWRLVASTLHTTLDIARGPLVRARVVMQDEDRPLKVLIVAHHLVMDGVSWRILIDDLQTAAAQLEQIEASAPIQLPPVPASFQRWALTLHERAAGTAIEEERHYWSRAATAVDSLVFDEDTAANARAARPVVVELSPDETQALLTSDRVDEDRTSASLLAALVASLRERCAGDALLVDVESHGRAESFTGLNLSRTVGWFTATYPLLIPIDVDGSVAGQLAIVRRILAAVPNGGIGYGLLAYLSPRRLTHAAVSVAFNYLGQFVEGSATAGAFVPSRDWTGVDRDPSAPRRYALDCVALVSGGQLRMEWSFDPRRFRRETIERLAARWQRAASELCHGSRAAREEIEYADAAISSADLDRVRHRFASRARD